MLNALSIDVEEYFQAHAYEKVIARADWDRLPGRVVANTRRVLRVLAEHGTRATFFVLGWVADRHPELVREIATAGHELGTHGYAHELVYRLTREQFAADLSRSLDAIARAAGRMHAVLGYRAPGFSLTDDSPWVPDILADHGIRYDSSVQPIAPSTGSALRGGKRVGLSGAGRFAERRGALWEFPVSTLRVGGRNWPVAGGGYFRLLPLWLTRRAIARINAEGHPAIVYLHPWELDPDEPDIPHASKLSRLRHRINVDKTEGRLRRILAEHRFGPMCEAFAPQLAAA